MVAVRALQERAVAEGLRLLNQERIIRPVGRVFIEPLREAFGEFSEAVPRAPCHPASKVECRVDGDPRCPGGEASLALPFGKVRDDPQEAFLRAGLVAVEAKPGPTQRVVDTVDHVSLGVNDLPAAKRFYDAALAPLGFRPHAEQHEVGYFLTGDTLHHDVFALFIGFEDPSAKRQVHASAGFHIAFRAPTREAVIQFYEAALQAGGRDNGPPGLRPQYHSDYFGAFVLDPDGHHLEAVCHVPDGATTRPTAEIRVLPEPQSG